MTISFNRLVIMQSAIKWVQISQYVLGSVGSKQFGIVTKESLSAGLTGLADCLVGSQLRDHMSDSTSCVLLQLLIHQRQDTQPLSEAGQCLPQCSYLSHWQSREPNRLNFDLSVEEVEVDRGGKGGGLEAYLYACRQYGLAAIRQIVNIRFFILWLSGVCIAVVDGRTRL